MSLKLPNGRVYPHSFTLDDLAALERFIWSHEDGVTLSQAAHGECVTYTDVVTGKQVDLPTVAIRHDVDHHIGHALRLARWEADRGIRSSYYLLPTADYYKDTWAVTSAAQEMQTLGHEVGVHNDAMSATQGDRRRGAALLKQWADEMRSWGITVTGCADHGGQISGSKLWRDVTPQDLGFDYEAYHLNRELDVNYVSDNRGRWQSPLEHVPGKLSLVLMHPCHWELP